MKITLESDDGTYICSAGGKQGPYDIAVNGERVLQIETPFRSETVKVRARKNRQVVFEFSVDKEYETLSQAASAAVAEEGAVPFSGTLVVDEGSRRQMESALQGLSIRQVGVTLRMRYRFVGEGFTTSSGSASIPRPK